MGSEFFFECTLIIVIIAYLRRVLYPIIRTSNSLVPFLSIFSFANLVSFTTANYLVLKKCIQQMPRFNVYKLYNTVLIFQIIMEINFKQCSTSLSYSGHLCIIFNCAKKSFLHPLAYFTSLLSLEISRYFVDFLGFRNVSSF